MFKQETKEFNLSEKKFPPKNIHLMIKMFPMPESNIDAKNILNKKIPTWRSRCFQCQGQSQVIQPEPQVFPQCTQKICKGFASKNIVNNKYKHLYWDTPLCDCVREKVDFSQIRTKIFESTLEGLWEFLPKFNTICDVVKM